VTRVAVTGIGLVTALGVGAEATWQRLLAGDSGIADIESYDASSLATRRAGEVRDFDPQQFANRKTLRSMTRNDQLALAGASLAVEDSGYEFPEEGSPRAGLFVGSNKEISNPMHILEASLVARNEDGSVDIRRLGAEASSAFYPLFYVEGLQAASIFYISHKYGLKGSNTYFAGTAEAGASAIGRGFRAVKRGEVDVAVAGGFDDASSWWSTTKLEPFGVLTSSECRPYDLRRSGTVLGEGAAFVVLEDLDAAGARGARVYAEIVGYGSAADTYRLITPDPEGRALATAIMAALREAAATPGEVQYAAADGTGTKLGDASEARAFQQVFRDGNGSMPVASSVKPATGNLIGGAGALNVLVSLLAVAHQAVPPTLNLEQPDPACTGIDWVPREARELAVANALAVARGIEGQSVALVARSV
jgi:3-oxoacyl-[acyl-carrier-protein] synthase II